MPPFSIVEDKDLLYLTFSYKPLKHMKNKCIYTKINLLTSEICCTGFYLEVSDEKDTK